MSKEELKKKIKDKAREVLELTGTLLSTNVGRFTTLFLVLAGYLFRVFTA